MLEQSSEASEIAALCTRCAIPKVQDGLGCSSHSVPLEKISFLDEFRVNFNSYIRDPTLLRVILFPANSLP